MSEKAKVILGVVLGVIGAILLFCLIVCIGCSVNGLTFGEQVCDWFTKKPVIDAVEEVAEAVSNTPIA